MAPRVPDSYLQARRDQIIDAACAAFMDRGLSKTTMPDIFKAAGLSPGAVYNYFSSKEDIIEAAAAKSLERNTEMMTGAASLPGINPILSVMRAYFPLLKVDGVEKAIALDLDLYSESTRNPRIAAAMKSNVDALLGQMETLVKREQEEGRLNRELDSRAVARYFIGSFFGLLISKVLDPDTDIDAAIQVNEAVVNGTFCRGENGPEPEEDEK